MLTAAYASRLDRFIPAHAGNSHSTLSGLVRRWATVHPRACGELGYRAGDLDRAQRLRFIPAHAGNSEPYSGSWCGSAPATVHPRACGELNEMLPCNFARLATVHPRACGELSAAPVAETSTALRNRFIPAHAGNSSEELHPRSCHRRFIPAHAGNSFSGAVVPCVNLTGSSPRMRGTRFAQNRLRTD